MVAGSGPNGEHTTADAAREYALQAERMLDRGPSVSNETEAIFALGVAVLAVATEIAALREAMDAIAERGLRVIS